DGFRTHSGIMLRTTQTDGASAGCLSFRPERAHIVRAGVPDDPALNALPATIRLFTYLGPVVECHLSLPDGQPIQVMLPNTSSASYTAFAEGTPVQVRWSPEDSRLLS